MMDGVVRVAIAYDARMDNDSYPLIYQSTHTTFKGEPTLFSFSQTARERLSSRVGHLFLLGGFRVDEFVVGKPHPGSHEEHMDCTLKLTMTLHASIRPYMHLNPDDVGVRGDIEMQPEGQRAILVMARKMAWLVKMAMFEELGATVVDCRVAKVRYIILK